MAVTTVVSSGQTSSGIVLGNGDMLVVSGGRAVSTAVTSGGEEDVFLGGVAIGTVVGSGGKEQVFSGGVASGTLLSNGGGELVLAGGVASGTIVTSGSEHDVYDGGVATGTVLSNGGRELVLSGGVASNTIVSSGGEEVITSGAVAIDTVLQLGGELDLSFIPFVSGGSASLDASSKVLTVSQGGTSYTQRLAGEYSGDTFHLTSDGVRGTLVTVACFRAGTRVLTDSGEVAVEDLRSGMNVVSLLHRRLLPVRWVGTSIVDCTRRRCLAHVWPVRIEVGALGASLPHRDLWLSPDHALFVDGALVPVRYLVNGATIEQVPCEVVRYFHVELDMHTVLLAEGVLAESYLDTANRSAFSNNDELVARQPTESDSALTGHSRQRGDPL